MQHNTYAARNAILKSIGFDSYADYLNSDLWISLRERVYREKGRVCFLCGRSATQVHHVGYGRKTLLGKKTGALKPVCGGCHHAIEFKGGEKLSIKNAQKQLRRVRRSMKEVKALNRR